jgi:hypothetical protein
MANCWPAEKTNARPTGARVTRFKTVPLKIAGDVLLSPPPATLVAELNCPNATPPKETSPNPVANAAHTNRPVRKRHPKPHSENSRVVYSLLRTPRYNLLASPSKRPFRTMPKLAGTHRVSWFTEKYLEITLAYMKRFTPLPHYPVLPASQIPFRKSGTG